MTRPDIPVARPGDAARARLAAGAAAQAAGLSIRQREQVALAVTELATNLVKHAGHGVICFGTPDVGRFDVLALDRGPGLGELDRSLRDGYSTTGSLGTGLGAVRRAADVFDVYTAPGQGTAILARWCAAGWSPAPWRVGAAMATAPGEVQCGDLWAAWPDDDCLVVVLADGLGHGAPAYEASSEVVRLASRFRALPPRDLLAAVDPMLTSTRGATVAAARFSALERRLCYGGVGNIAARLVPAPGGPVIPLVSRPGIVGARQARAARPWCGEFGDDSWLVLHTDGVSERWSIDEWDGLLEHDPSIVAAWLLAQRGRWRDDACVVALAGRGA